MTGIQHNDDSFARFIGGAVKLAAPDATVGTLGGTGNVTLAGGQGFEFTVRELDPAEAAATRSGEREATAWELVGRMHKFLGHIQDMGDDERLFMLGALTGTLEGMLRDAGVPEPPEGGQS